MNVLETMKWSESRLTEISELIWICLNQFTQQVDFKSRDLPLIIKNRAVIGTRNAHDWIKWNRMFFYSHFLVLLFCINFLKPLVCVLCFPSPSNHIIISWICIKNQNPHLINTKFLLSTQPLSHLNWSSSFWTILFILLLTFFSTTTTAHQYAWKWGLWNNNRTF